MFWCVLVGRTIYTWQTFFKGTLGFNYTSHDRDHWVDFESFFLLMDTIRIVSSRCSKLVWESRTPYLHTMCGIRVRVAHRQKSAAPDSKTTISQPLLLQTSAHQNFTHVTVGLFGWPYFCRICSVVHSRKAATAYFSSEQLLPFGFAGRLWWPDCIME